MGSPIGVGCSTPPDHAAACSMTDSAGSESTTSAPRDRARAAWARWVVGLRCGAPGSAPHESEPGRLLLPTTGLPEGGGPVIGFHHDGLQSHRTHG